jgi:hypothetical protein
MDRDSHRVGLKDQAAVFGSVLFAFLLCLGTLSRNALGGRPTFMLPPCVRAWYCSQRLGGRETVVDPSVQRPLSTPPINRIGAPEQDALGTSIRTPLDAF